MDISACGRAGENFAGDRGGRGVGGGGVGGGEGGGGEGGGAATLARRKSAFGQEIMLLRTQLEKVKVRLRYGKSGEVAGKGGRGGRVHVQQNDDNRT